MSQQKVNLPATQILFHGLKAEYHRQRHLLKQARPGHITDAGMDIYASPVQPEITVYGAMRAELKLFTNVHVTPPIGTFAMITSRSSSAKNLAGATVRTGIIDAGYTGELRVILEIPVLMSEEVIACILKCAAEEVAVAQLIVLPSLVVFPELANEQQLEQIRAVSRGDNGFGSTDRPPMSRN